MTEPAWEFEHSIECNAPREFCWGYWTNIANWDDPPARFHLEGPFANGSRTTTELPGQTLHSVIRDVEDCSSSKSRTSPMPADRGCRSPCP